MNGLLIVALFCLVMAGYALASGTLIMRGSYTRVENPFWFWFGTVAYTVLGLVSLVLALNTHS